MELHRTGQGAQISRLFLCALKKTFLLQRTDYKSVTMEELRIVKEGLKRIQMSDNELQGRDGDRELQLD